MEEKRKKKSWRKQNNEGIMSIPLSNQIIHFTFTKSLGASSAHKMPSIVPSIALFTNISVNLEYQYFC